MEHIHLCHRASSREVEFATVEHFPAQNINEIWNQGHDAVEVLRVFAGEQCQVVQVWTADLEAQLREFLAENYPGQDMSRVEGEFIRRLMHGDSLPYIQTSMPSHSQGVPA